LLRDHPRFKEVSDKGLLVRDEDGQPTMVQFWDEVGAYLDFTNPETVTWWKAGVTKSLLEYGIAATWNDNNEFEIWNQNAWIEGFGEKRNAAEAKTLQTLLMMPASWEAQREFAPEKRPFLVNYRS
jgi:alpha-glucosidase